MIHMQIGLWPNPWRKSIFLIDTCRLHRAKDIFYLTNENEDGVEASSQTGIYFSDYLFDRNNHQCYSFSQSWSTSGIGWHFFDLVAEYSFSLLHWAVSVVQRFVRSIKVKSHKLNILRERVRFSVGGDNDVSDIQIYGQCLTNISLLQSNSRTLIVNKF